MIENRPLTIICDFCSETQEADSDEFHEALREWKRSGWRTYKDHYHEWTHKCPVCIMKEQESRNKGLDEPYPGDKRK